WQAMRDFTETRDSQTPDEIWVCEHDPVFTLGLAGDPAHVLDKKNIPVVKTDRGGQVTYHGPGQVVVYPLIDLRRWGLKVKEYVHLLEQSAIDTLVSAGVDDAQRKPGAPGVYTGWNALKICRMPLEKGGELAKIAALGIKIRKGCAYHGLSLNVHMDLAPFKQINPCGYAGLNTIDLATADVRISKDEISSRLVKNVISKLEQLSVVANRS
ncbi:MAG: lipoyl(octanoyl) transferase LipB, partial [Limnobacter sp.]|nr:lipoyl(octanoyl) transferase LipB [Limnobacter sp.]